MKRIGQEEIENVAIGAALLGTGGGGNPNIGKLMAQQAIEKHGPVQLIEADALPQDVLVASSSMMGAPTVLSEKIPSGEEAITAFRTLERYMNKQIYATFPIEAGGVNSLLPFVVAAQLGLPVVDADGMGRAFPELQMVTFHLDGMLPTPLIVADEKGNVTLLDTVDGFWAEKLARNVTIQKGGSTSVAQFPIQGQQLKESGIRGILQLEEQIGQTLRSTNEQTVNPVDEIIKMTQGVELFRGKIADIDRKTQTGFAMGVAKIEGFDQYKSNILKLYFQNEFLLATLNDNPRCITPDLITVLDTETGLPITTEGLRYGIRCVVVGIPSNPRWRSKKGIETVGPRYFGYDVAYQPVEELVAERIDTK